MVWHVTISVKTKLMKKRDRIIGVARRLSLIRSFIQVTHMHFKPPSPCNLYSRLSTKRGIRQGLGEESSCTKD